MKLSEYITHLTTLLDQNGDLEVTTLWVNGHVIKAPQPEIRNMCVLKGRESTPRYFCPWDQADREGELVAKI